MGSPGEETDMSNANEYTIKRRRHPQGYQTMVITPRDAPEAAAEYRLTAGREQAQIAAMRRELDKHLAAPGGTLGNYQW
jgi:hypothetical protein